MESILEILQRLAGREGVEQLLALAGGRQWYLPTLGSFRRMTRYRAICSFPSRDYKVVARHFRVSERTVFRAWKAGGP